jgi:hypothetical protein
MAYPKHIQLWKLKRKIDVRLIEFIYIARTASAGIQGFEITYRTLNVRYIQGKAKSPSATCTIGGTMQVERWIAKINDARSRGENTYRITYFGRFCGYSYSAMIGSGPGITYSGACD